MLRFAASSTRRGLLRFAVPVQHVRFSSSVPVRPISKLLIANRGEIACRVAKTAKKMGIRTVAVYSEADRYARHVAMADESYLIGPPSASQSYLRQDRILDVAQRSGAQAIHPGYGFLSENEQFAIKCAEEGVIFVGPPVPALNAMASKSASKDIMIDANVPVVPGYHGEDQSMERFRAEAEKMKDEYEPHAKLYSYLIGFPLIAKAFLGGGGKGMRIVNSMDELEECISSCQREALASFGDNRVLIEKYLQRPRHIEFQVFADQHNNYMHFFERDCSLQRRHQKVIEEAPAPGMTEEWRNEMGLAAVNAARAVGYEGAGTVEFIVDHDKRFFFMEMNTRLQVEHPVTEMITGLDLVELQLMVASGRPIPFKQEDLKINGHSFEARVYAEDPDSGFLPCTGKLSHLSPPAESDSVRVETGVRQGDEVSVYYDPMIAKLVVHDIDRDRALKKLCENLKDYQIAGLSTNIPFLLRCAEHPSFVEGDVETNFIPKYKEVLLKESDGIAPDSSLVTAVAGILLNEKPCSAGARDPWDRLSGYRINVPRTREITLEFGEEPRTIQIEYTKSGRADEVAAKVTVDGNTYDMTAARFQDSDSKVVISLDGRRTTAHVVAGEDEVHVFDDGINYTFGRPAEYADDLSAAAGSLIAPMPGKIVKIVASPGDAVKKGDPLIIMEAMKMEVCVLEHSQCNMQTNARQHTIRASHDGTVAEVFYKLDDIVDDKAVLAKMSDPEE